MEAQGAVYEAPLDDADLDLDRRVLDYLLRLDMDGEALKRVTSIRCEAGFTPLLGDIWGAWDGESDTFNITELQPIVGCTSLTTLHLALLGEIDLGPLAALPRLREVRLVGGTVVDLTPLLSLPKLERLVLRTRVRNGGDAIDRLSARGVEVTTLKP